MEPKLVKAFEIRARVGAPTFIGQDGKSGRAPYLDILYPVPTLISGSIDPMVWIWSIVVDLTYYIKI